MKMDDLIAFLSQLPDGPVETQGSLDIVLADCWTRFRGWREGGMQGHKLINRMESVVWNSPILSFVVERHGGVVMGAKKAELQHWEVDIHSKTAEIVKTKKRLILPLAAKAPVKKIAAEIAEIIESGKEDPRLLRKKDGIVRLRIADILPEGEDFKVTVSGRRKRLRAYILETLSPHGWEEAGTNGFRKKES
jgi:hypothetical protein